MNLEGAVAVVTGGSRGIGRAICVALGRVGARVAVVARTDVVEDPGLPGSVALTVAEVRSCGAEAIPVVADVGDDADRERLVAAVRAQLGDIDVLVNNAAFTVPGRPGRRPARSAETATMPGPLDAPLAAVRRQLEVNLIGPLHLMQLVMPGMVQRRRGAVLNISSDASRRPGEGPWAADADEPGPWAYGGSKAALEHLTCAVAHATATADVAVNALLPSRPVRTPGVTYFAPDLSAEEPERFAAAAIALLRRPVTEGTGQLLYSEDVLQPGLGRRGWLG